MRDFATDFGPVDSDSEKVVAAVAEKLLGEKDHSWRSVIVRIHLKDPDSKGRIFLAERDRRCAVCGKFEDRRWIRVMNRVKDVDNYDYHETIERPAADGIHYD